MKIRNLVLVAAVSVCVGLIIFKQPSETKPELKIDETRAEVSLSLSDKQSTASIEKPREPQSGEHPDLPQLKDLVLEYTSYDEPRLEEILKETEEQIQKGDLIARANAGNLSPIEQIELKRILRVESAARIAKMKISLKKPISS